MDRARRAVPLCLTVLALLAALGGCNDDNDNDRPATTTRYAGTFTGSSGESGVLSLTVQQPPPAGVSIIRATITTSGTATVSGAGSVSLTGTFDDVTGELNVSGGGYTFSGIVANGEVMGDYAGPNGPGAFVALQATGANVTVYCGTFEGDATGMWNVAVSSDGTVAGAFTDATNASSSLTGTVSSNNVALEDPAGDVTANGTIAGGSVTGTWTDVGSGDTGNWTASTGACS
jgi:hypothetical protein